MMCGHGENPPRVAAAPLMGLGKGRRTILCRLGCTYAEDSLTPCIGLNLIQHNTSNTSRSHNSATADAETGSKLIEHRGGDALHEDVGELRCQRTMEYADLTDDDSLSDKMKINLHMFDALMLNGVGGEVHDADVVVVDESAPRRRTLELMEQLAQQVASAMPLATAWYSASVLDRETTVCRLANQDTRLFSRNTV
jgi:hypothetical protein